MTLALAIFGAVTGGIGRFSMFCSTPSTDRAS
jgi:hypothetical protein